VVVNYSNVLLRSRIPSQNMKKMRLIPLDIPNHGMIMIMHKYKLSQRYWNWQMKR
jgi:hypothetical protein